MGVRGAGAGEGKGDGLNVQCCRLTSIAEDPGRRAAGGEGGEGGRGGEEGGREAIVFS